jgi:succinate dehydrogenase/fumarate reductase cytochrome b subunit
MNRWSRNKYTAGWSSYRAYGLLFMITSTFAALVTFSWVISFLFDYLNSIHQFQHDISRMVEKMEIGLFYLCTVVCGLIVSSGVIRVIFSSAEGK